ncbi:MAG: DUF11 domain-containing protein [Phycisphaerae bacterium]|nr:DUF11 domain-containing protein [Phycisphaerae bacterium]
MKVGKLFMTGSLVFCLGLSIMLSGCSGDGGGARLDTDNNMIETQQVACDTVEVSRYMQYYPVSSDAGKAVSLEKFAPKTIKADSPFDYDLKVTNMTDSTITNVVVADKVATEMVFVESSIPMQRVSDNQVQWAVGSLEPKASAQIKSRAVVNGTDSVMSCAQVFYDCPVCAKITILKTDLKLSMSAPKEVMSCDRIELKYKVVNYGTAAACDIVIKETLPDGLMTSDGKDVFEFTLASLDPGETWEFSKMVDPLKTGKFVSKAVLSSSSVDSLESNAVEINVVEPVISLKESTPESKPLEVGRIFEYVLSNDGHVTASNAMIVAMLPEGVVLTSATDNGKVSEEDPRLVSWKLGDLKPNASKKVTMVIDGQGEIVINPQAVAKASCSQAVAATPLPELKELLSVSLYKPLVPE